MSETRVSLRFSRAFEGVLEAAHATARIGKNTDGCFKPYDFMLGALGSCYYATFVDIADKMRLEYEAVDIDIHGVKREEVPTTLKTVTMQVTVRGAKEQKGFRRAAELAGKYCSVHETISRVADITLELVFEEQ